METTILFPSVVEDNEIAVAFQVHFHPVFPVHAQQGDLLTTFISFTVMECMLRCSRITECNSVAIVGINTGRSSGDYCQLYRTPFEESLDHKIHRENK